MGEVLIVLAFAALAPLLNRLGRSPARWAGIAWIGLFLFGPIVVWTLLAPMFDRGYDGDFLPSAAGMLASYAALWGIAILDAVARKVITTLSAWRRRSP